MHGRFVIGLIVCLTLLLGVASFSLAGAAGVAPTPGTPFVTPPMVPNVSPRPTSSASPIAGTPPATKPLAAGDLYPALQQLQAKLTYTLMVPGGFAPEAVGTSSLHDTLVMPPGRFNSDYASSPVQFSFFERTNPGRRVILQQGEFGSFGKIAPLSNGVKTIPVTIGTTTGQLQVALGINPGEPLRMQLIWSDGAHSYIALALLYSEDELVQLASSLTPVR